MPIKHHTCVTLACDVCGEPFNADADSYSVRHFDDQDEAAQDARDYDWYADVIDGVILCGSDDGKHCDKARELAAHLTGDDLESLYAVYPQLVPDDDAAEPASTAPATESGA